MGQDDLCLSRVLIIILILPFPLYFLPNPPHFLLLDVIHTDKVNNVYFMIVLWPTPICHRSNPTLPFFFTYPCHCTAIFSPFPFLSFPFVSFPFVGN